MKTCLPNLRTAFAVATMVAAMPVSAFDIDTLELLTQEQFRLVSKDLGAALSYKPLQPAEPLGVVGFDIGIAVTGTSLQSVGQLEQASGGDDVPSTLPVPTFRIAKGLPFGFDIGGAFAAVPGSSIRLVGGELRWALLAGSTLVPALAVRLSATRLSGADQLDLRTTGIDVSVSKGFALFTPYAGIGRVLIKSTPEGAGSLQQERFWSGKAFAGLNFNLLGNNLVVEVDRTGGISSGGVKYGFRF